MKAQRYTYSEVYKDIMAAEQNSFYLNDLASMLAELPFYLNNEQIEKVLEFIFETNDLEEDMEVSTKSFTEKLRQLIDDFYLVEPEEDKQLTESIVRRIDENSDFLLAELEKHSSSRGCIAR